MSYIAKDNRDLLLVAPLGDCPLMNSEELSFAILVLMKRHFAGDSSLCSANEVIGALENAKLEFQRTVITPFNRQQQFDNGDA